MFEPLARLASLARRSLRQRMCGLSGHDMLMHFERKRVALKCTTCGFESPGWSLPGHASIRHVRPSVSVRPQPAGSTSRLPLIRPRRAA
jgi:hypothetical protein